MGYAVGRNFLMPVWNYLSKPRSLRVYLVALSIALLVPLSFVSIWLMVGFVSSEMQSGRDQLARDAIGIGNDVDREMSGLLTVLDTLATSTSLRSGDLAAFHSRAAEALGPRQAYVLLVDADMQQVLNTRRPFGTALPKTSDVESARSVLQTRETRISDSFVGQVSGQRVVNLLRPVVEGGQARYVLIVTVNTDRFEPILRAGKSREAYAVSLLDGAKELMAKAYPDGLSLVGTAALDQAKPQRKFSVHAIGGEAWLEASHQSQLTGWRTVIRIPRATVDGPLWRSLYLLGLTALVTIGAAAAVITFVARRVSAGLAIIRDGTLRLAAGQQLSSMEPAVLEAMEIMGDLRVASDLVEARTRNLRESEARYRAALRLGKMGSWETDFARLTRAWSPEAAALFDLQSTKGIVGGQADELIGAMHPDDQHLLARYHHHLLSHDDLDAEYRIVLRDGAVRYVAGRGLVVSRQHNGRPHVMINVVADVTDRAIAEEHLSEFANNLAHSNARFQALVDATAQIVWSASPSGKFIEDSPSWRSFTGQPYEAFAGDGWMDMVHPDDRDRTRKAWTRAILEREVYEVDYRLRHASGGYRWTRTRGVPLTTASGAVVEWVGMNEDIDDRVKRTEQMDVVMRELSHRTKNLLAVIQSIARRTFAEERDTSPRVRTFLDRLQGLAVSHDLLVHANWSGVSLQELVREHLKPFIGSADTAVEIDGPHLTVSPSAAQNLGLALHELATNAAKYGALKVGADKLRISWSREIVANTAMLDFRWREDLPLADVDPGRKGFGKQLLDSIVGTSLGGRTDYSVSGDGVNWHLVVPIARLTDQH